MNHQIQLDTGSRFCRLTLTREDDLLARKVSPLFLAYLQNKIEAYASALVESKLPYRSNPTEQVETILAHEKLRNFVEAYTELQAELLEALATSEQTER
jgi:hypothetical protein